MASPRPNVLFVFADQMRGMAMGCAGNSEVRTPSMDGLALEGTRFSHAFANCPVCTPSRAMLLSGCYPLTTGVIANDLPLPEDTPTVGAAFQAAGYRTGYIGKWHLDGVPRDKWTPPGPRRHGFDDWAAFNCSHNYFRPDKYYRDNPEPVMAEGYEPEVQTDLALAFLAKRDSRPFCLFLSWGPPHDPYPMVPERFKAMYDPQHLTVRPNVQPLRPASVRLGRNLEPRQTLADYYAAISALDEQLGRLLDALQATGLDRNTIVVFTSDHGDQLWSQGTMKKQQPYEESISIPLLARWPGHIPAGRVSDALLGIVDYAPTLLALAGVPPLPTAQGESRSDLFLGRQTQGAASVLLLDVTQTDESHAQQLPEWRGLRTSRHTYACRQDGTDWLLFDNAADPYQLENHVEDPAWKSVRQELKAELAGWLRRTSDPMHSGQETLRALGLVDLWNARQRALHPGAPQLLEVN
jgi:arylsulfatase A-like enzyme